MSQRRTSNTFWGRTLPSGAMLDGCGASDGVTRIENAKLSPTRLSAVTSTRRAVVFLPSMGQSTSYLEVSPPTSVRLRVAQWHFAAYWRRGRRIDRLPSRRPHRSVRADAVLRRCRLVRKTTKQESHWMLDDERRFTIVYDKIRLCSRQAGGHDSHDHLKSV